MNLINIRNLGIERQVQTRRASVFEHPVCYSGNDRVRVPSSLAAKFASLFQRRHRVHET
jgi:hypothetical protein